MWFYCGATDIVHSCHAETRSLQRVVELIEEFQSGAGVLWPNVGERIVFILSKCDANHKNYQRCQNRATLCTYDCVYIIIIIRSSTKLGLCLLLELYPYLVNENSDFELYIEIRCQTTNYRDANILKSRRRFLNGLLLNL